MSDKDIEEFKQELINSIGCIQEGTGCSEGFSYTCFGEGDLEQALKIIEELETYKKIAEKLADELRYQKGMKQDYMFCVDICGDNWCDEENCKQCIIDWARKEVEKC